LIDLHTHTNESDGSYSPEELVRAAIEQGLDALAISDHDTFAGYDQVSAFAHGHGLDLVCGIELSTRMAVGKSATKNVHLLGYFLHEPPSFAFREWLAEILLARRARNQQLVERLKERGVAIELHEVEALGRSLAGRPHFARLLVQKGYATDTDQAFRKYLAESAPTFVERDSPHLAFAIQQIVAGGGVPVVAHPIRLGVRDFSQEETLILEMQEMGLCGLEAYHSDHNSHDIQRYLALAQKYGLAVSGGSDFHGTAKPQIGLGTGYNGNLHIPREVLTQLRERACPAR
jgi:3',5'-nucleoside bisphosphate phosphatase